MKKINKLQVNSYRVTKSVSQAFKFCTTKLSHDVLDRSTAMTRSNLEEQLFVGAGGGTTVKYMFNASTIHMSDPK